MTYTQLARDTAAGDSARCRHGSTTPDRAGVLGQLRPVPASMPYVDCLPGHCTVAATGLQDAKAAAAGCQSITVTTSTPGGHPSA